MYDVHHIALCGLAGVGKGTIGPILAEELGVMFYSAGESFRALAATLGVTPATLEKMAIANPKVDLEVDRRLREFGINNWRQGWVIEGRRAVDILSNEKTIPVLRKILLTCSDGVRHGRIWKRDKYDSPETARLATEKREKETSERYSELYGQTLAQLVNPDNFDLVVNTEEGTPGENCDKILSWLEG